MRRLWSPALSGSILSHAFVLVVLCTVGTLLAHFAPVPPRRGPEWNEQLAYVGLIVAVPFALLGAVLVSQWAATSRGAHDGLAVAAFAIAAVAATVWSKDIPRVLVPRWWLVPLFLAGAVMLALGDRLLVSKRWPAWVLGLLCVMAVALTVSWRVYALPSVADPYAFQAHIEAFLFSIARIFHGGTCLVEVVPQYGCYGEIVALLLRPLGLTILHVTILLAALQLAALISILWFCHRIIRNPLVLFACGIGVLFVLNRAAYGIADPYFQYTPLRLFFPALSLPAVLEWQRHRSLARASGLGMFAAVGIVTNLDSGAVVLGALALFIVFNRLRSSTLRSQAVYAGTFLASASLALALIGLGLSAKAHAWIDAGLFIKYQRLVLELGILAIPMPRPPHAWVVGIACAAVVLTMFALQLARGPIRPRIECAAYLAVLGAGLFSYYVSRSDITVLLLAGWPLLILAFFLLDDAVSGKWGHPALALGAVVLAVLVMVVFTASFVASWEPISNASTARWRGMLDPPSTGETRDVQFIRSRTNPDEPIAVLALSQAAILSEAQRPVALTGPGLWEIFREAEVDDLADWLAAKGPRHLFVDFRLLDYRLLGWSKPLMGALRWFPIAFPRIQGGYRLAEWGPDSRLMHLVRRDAGEGKDLFSSGPSDDPPSTALQVVSESETFSTQWGRPFEVPFQLPVPLGLRQFEFQMRVAPGRDEEPYATLIGNQCCHYQGFVVFRSPRTEEAYTVVLCDGSRCSESLDFKLISGIEHDLRVRFVEGRLWVAVDGEVQVDTSFGGLAVSPIPVYVGSWLGGSRPFRGPVSRLTFVDHTSRPWPP